MSGETTALSARSQAEHWIMQPGMRERILGSLPLKDAAARERFLNVMLNVVRKDPKVTTIHDQQSVLGCCIDAANLGLEINTPLHQASIVEYGGKAVLMIEYRGLADLMRRSGLLRNIHTGIVRKNDKYRRTATSWEFECDPFGTEEERGPIVGAYCILDLTDGTTQYETMSTAQIEAVRAMSRAKDGPAWKKSWEEMARKTVLRRASKLLPWSPEDARRIEIVDRTEFGGFDDTAEVEIRPPEAPARGTRAVLEKVRKRPEPAPEAPEPEYDHEAASQAAQAARDEGEAPPEVGVDPGASQGPPAGSPLDPPEVIQVRPPVAPTARLPLAADLEVHLEESRPVFSAMQFPKWDRWTMARQQAVSAAMRAYGTTSPSEFWAVVSRYTGSMSDLQYEGLKSMEDLLRSFAAAQHPA